MRTSPATPRAPGALLAIALLVPSTVATVPVAASVVPLVPPPGLRDEETPPVDEPPGRAAFIRLCARCHGEDGSGRGVTELDRPARSFADGGFSFGNTREAIARTIVSGIPGSPMPAFGDALSDAELTALADYVIALGPPQQEVAADETRLRVDDRAQIVRGILPPISEDAVTRPRGLLLGTPDGFTFEYRADDVRLLGVRQGGFVARADWTGRGGSPLQPLGVLVHLVDGGDPGPHAHLAPPGGDPAPLRARLAATGTPGRRAVVVYDLVDDEGRPLARVHEEVAARGWSLGSGFERRLQVGPGTVAPPAPLAFDFEPARAQRLERFTSPPVAALAGATHTHWSVHEHPDGVVELTAITTARTNATRVDADAPGTLTLTPDRIPAALVVTTLTVPDWSDEVRERLLTEVER